MASREISTFCLPQLLSRFLEACKSGGLDVMLTCVARKVIEQRALYAQGREALSVVNALRVQAGMPLIRDIIKNGVIVRTAQAQNVKVTWTMNSLHIVDAAHPLSRAFDIAVKQQGVPFWNLKIDVDADGVPDYEEVGRVGESLGLVWGGRFSKPDCPHFQIAA